MNLLLAVEVLGTVFIAELPGKTFVSALVLSTRFRALAVWLGAAIAFGVQVGIALALGHALSLAPKKIVDAVVGILFAGGGLWMLLGSEKAEEKRGRHIGEHFVGQESVGEEPNQSRSFYKIATRSFVLVFMAEWGDITQIVTANFAAKYSSFASLLSVGLGSWLGLTIAGALAVGAGSKLAQKFSMNVLRRLAGIVFLILAILSFVKIL